MTLAHHYGDGKVDCERWQRHAIWTSSYAVHWHYVNMRRCDITPTPRWTWDVLVTSFDSLSGRHVHTAACTVVCYLTVGTSYKPRHSIPECNGMSRFNVNTGGPFIISVREFNLVS